MLSWLNAELRRLGKTCLWSWRGFASAWATEKTLRQWTLANVISVGFAFWLPLTTTERALILALGLLLLAAELINTAIEVVVVRSPGRLPDRRGPEFGWMENIPVETVWEAWQGLPHRRRPA